MFPSLSSSKFCLLKMSPTSEESLKDVDNKRFNSSQMDSDLSGEKPSQERVEDVGQATTDEESQQETRVSGTQGAEKGV